MWLNIPRPFPLPIVPILSSCHPVQSFFPFLSSPPPHFPCLPSILWLHLPVTVPLLRVHPNTPHFSNEIPKNYLQLESNVTF